MKLWAGLSIAVSLSLAFAGSARAQEQAPQAPPQAMPDSPAKGEGEPPDAASHTPPGPADDPAAAPDSALEPKPGGDSPADGNGTPETTAETDGQVASEPDSETGSEPDSEPDSETGAAAEAPDATEADAAPAPVPVPVVIGAAPAAPKPALKYKASFFTRYESRDQYDTLGASRGRFMEGDNTAYRARVGAHLPAVALSDRISASAVFSVQASGFLGHLSTTIGDAPFRVYEGYAHIRGKRHSLDLGRFSMNYGEALVIGNVDWHQAGRSFEGVRAGLLGPGGQYRVDLFATQINEGLPLSGNGDGDSYFYGAYALLGPLYSSTMALDVYALGRTFMETPDVLVGPGPPVLSTQAHATTATLGARVKDRSGAWDYRFEGGVQLGTALTTPGMDSPSVFAFHGDLEVGYNRGDLRVSLEALYASGDDPDTEDRHEGWNELFPTGHKWLGLTDVFGARTNVYGGALHLSYAMGRAKPAQPGAAPGSPSLIAKLDAHVFARPHRVNGSTGYAGAEFDAILVKPLGKGLKLSGLLGVFRPDQAIYGTEELATYGEVQLRLDIK